MTQTAARVATCTGQPGPFGKSEVVPHVACFLADGTTGYFTFVDVYVSDRPLPEVLTGTPPTGADDLNVSADIFVGAVLVAVFVLGWIAGAQR